MILLILALLLILAGQWLTLRALGPIQAIGDEITYLESSGNADPHQPEWFLRVPLFKTLFVWSRKLTGKAEAVTWLILVGGYWRCLQPS
jgi:hypothetical protein